jgi:hypothetical protein
LVGDPKSPPPGAADWDLPWEERPKTTLEVDDETTLAEILDRAGEAFGAEPFMPLVPISEIVHWIAFEDGSGRPLRDRARSSLTLLDEDDRAVWGVHNWAAVPFGQLDRSAKAGMLRGDARRIYLIRQVPQGDAELIIESGRIFLEVLAIARDGFERLGDVGERLAGLAFLAIALKKGLGRVQRLHARWAQRGAKPSSLPDVLPGADTDAELARRLGCNEEDATLVRQILTALHADDPLVGAFRRSLAEADVLARDLLVDCQAVFRIRVEELKAGREEPEPISLDQLSIDFDRWQAEHFQTEHEASGDQPEHPDPPTRPRASP